LNIALTFDLEKDANLQSTYGMTIGLNKILKILEKYSIRSTFFVTSYIAHKFPEFIQKLSRIHEIGSHGYEHKKYVEVGEFEKKGLKKAKLMLEEITGKEIIGFRAPKLHTNLNLYKALQELGFRYDASGKPNSNINSIFGLKIFKVSIFNVFFRFPIGKKYFRMKYFEKPNSLSVLYWHPWEAIDMKRLYISKKKFANLLTRPDRWVNTGENFLARLEELINFFKNKKFNFRTLNEML